MINISKLAYFDPVKKAKVKVVHNTAAKRTAHEHKIEHPVSFLFPV